MLNFKCITLLSAFFITVTHTFALELQPDGAQTVQPQQTSDIASFPVLIEHHGQYQAFAEPPRLAIALYQYHQQTDIYWPTARLYQLDTAANARINQLRLQVVASLKQLTRGHAQDKRLAMQLIELANTLDSFQYARPLDIVLDPSLTLVDPKANPRLTTGRYLLATPQRRGAIAFIGLGGQVFQPLVPTQAVWQLFADSKFAAQQQVDEVWLIEPYQPIRTIPVASWNRQQLFVNVGALLFVPLPEAVLTDEFSQLNSEIAELLSYRVSQ